MLKPLLFILACLIVQGENAKILGIFHFPSKSHHILGSTLLKALAERGHQVTMLSPYPFKNRIKNYEDIELTGMLDRKEESKLMETILKSQNASELEKFSELRKQLSQVNHFYLNHVAVQDLIASKRKFDLVIQCYAWNDAYLGLPYLLGASTILFSTIGSSVMSNGIMKNPSPPAYVPNVLLTYPSEMNFLQRVGNTVFNVAYEFYEACFMLPEQEQLRQQYFPDTPSVKQLISNISLVLLNSHYSIESPRPYVPGMIPIGGFHVQEPKELPKDVKYFMDSATEGVVFFSLGSNIRSSDLSKDQLQSIISTFAELPLKVLWKFETDVDLNLPANVKTGKWLPQSDILAHPNLKLFVTHGGLLSTTEAVHHGVPMVGIPIFGDQPMNVEQGVIGGYMVKVPFEKLTQNVLTTAIEEVLKNPKYRENIRHRSRVLKDQPLKPLENAIFWIEYVLRHNGAHHLKTSASNLEWYQYYLLDVIAFILGILLTALAIVYFVIYAIVKILKKLFFTKKVEGSSNRKRKSKIA